MPVRGGSGRKASADFRGYSPRESRLMSAAVALAWPSSARLAAQCTSSVIPSTATWTESCWLWLDWPAIRRVLVERVANPGLVVAAHIITHEPEEMAFLQRDHVVQDLPATASDPSFGGSILPESCLRIVAAGEGSRVW